VTWQYHASDVPFGRGRLTLMSDPSGETAYDYDRQGRLVREGVPDNGEITLGGGGPTTYAYDADGNLANLGYPSGAHVQYASDRAGRPITVTRGTTTLVSAVDYLPFGPLTKIVFGNGTTRESVYDQRYRMTGNKLLTAAGTLADYQYSNDDIGNITAIADALDATYNRTFGYDDLSRLTSAAPAPPSGGAGRTLMTGWGTCSRSS
jgi:YD repeat-containing protein